MGITDKAWFKIICEECGETELSSADDKGFGLRGASWGNIKPVLRFSIETEGGGDEEPQITNAVCNSCGGKGAVEIKHGFNPPKDF